MKRALLILAALALRGAFAAPELLAPPQFGDPTRMCAYSCSNVMDVATAYFSDDQASNFTAIVWMKWTPRSNYVPSSLMVPFVMSGVSADPARATMEGGDGLPDLQSHRYETPIALSGGTWGETCLPASYDYPDSTLSAWQYGCYAVNIETDTALTLNVGGAEKSISASPEKQRFNILATSASRSVSISAASSSATVKFAIAENPLVQFFGAQFDDNPDGGGNFYGGANGGLVSNEWRMVVFRGRIAAGSATCDACGYNATAKLPITHTSTKALWHPRTTFARNARIRVMVASLQGIQYEGKYDTFHLYGFRVYRGWFDDATIERMRDQDAAEMTRRGM